MVLMKIKDKRTKKLPSDYPQMIFRVNQEDKDQLHTLIDRVVRLANRRQGNKGLKQVRKNDVIVEALLMGLQRMEKKFFLNK